ncbi:hypothetical protein ACNKHT_03685 [Shigella flexneri]
MAHVPPNRRCTANWHQGFSCPVGFKNGTDGTIKVAIDAINARRCAALLPVRNEMGAFGDCDYQRCGDCHIILAAVKSLTHAKHVAEVKKG